MLRACGAQYIICANQGIGNNNNNPLLAPPPPPGGAAGERLVLPQYSPALIQNQRGNHGGIISNIMINSSSEEDEHSRPIQQLETYLNERLSPSIDVSVNPTDVLCGRGKTSFNHIGNKRFRHSVTSSLRSYMEADTRFEKSMVVHSIVDSIHTTGGRFLKRNNTTGEWYQLSDQQAKEKVGHAIRDAVNSHEYRKVKKQKRQQQQQQQQQQQHHHQQHKKKAPPPTAAGAAAAAAVGAGGATGAAAAAAAAAVAAAGNAEPESDTDLFSLSSPQPYAASSRRGMHSLDQEMQSLASARKSQFKFGQSGSTTPPIGGGLLSASPSRRRRRVGGLAAASAGADDETAGSIAKLRGSGISSLPFGGDESSYTGLPADLANRILGNSNTSNTASTGSAAAMAAAALPVRQHQDHRPGYHGVSQQQQLQQQQQQQQQQQPEQQLSSRSIDPRPIAAGLHPAVDMVRRDRHSFYDHQPQHQQQQQQQQLQHQQQQQLSSSRLSSPLPMAELTLPRPPAPAIAAAQGVPAAAARPVPAAGAVPAAVAVPAALSDDTDDHFLDRINMVLGPLPPGAQDPMAGYFASAPSAPSVPSGGDHVGDGDNNEDNDDDNDNNNKINQPQSSS